MQGPRPGGQGPFLCHHQTPSASVWTATKAYRLDSEMTFSRRLLDPFCPLLFLFFSFYEKQIWSCHSSPLKWFPTFLTLGVTAFFLVFQSLAARGRRTLALPSRSARSGFVWAPCGSLATSPAHLAACDTLSRRFRSLDSESRLWGHLLRKAT